MSNTEPSTNGMKSKQANMNEPSGASAASKTKPILNPSASYFGLMVEVIERMTNNTLVRHGRREVVVGSADLNGGLALKRAA